MRYPGVSVACRRNFVYTSGSEFRLGALLGLWPDDPLDPWTDDAMNTSFFGELLQTISERGRALVDRTIADERRSVG